MEETKLCLIICLIICIVSCILVYAIYHQLKSIQNEIKSVKSNTDTVYLQFLHWLKHAYIISERYEQCDQIDKVINNIIGKRER